MKNRSFLCALIVVALFLNSCGESRVVESGSTWTVDETIKLSKLTLEENASIEAPEGYVLSMTIDGVETGIAPGTYSGKIVITKAAQNIVLYSSPESTIEHQFRQAFYIDSTGLVEEKSVLSAAGKYTFKDGTLTGGNIQSVGESFNGLFVCGGNVVVKDITIRLTGNGGNDFAGWGSGIMSTGENTTLVVDGADVYNKGAIRTAVIAQGGSNLIVKNSTIRADGGVLPDDYVSNVTPGQMKDAPWMLGINGNNRATNILGPGTQATYINSYLFAEGWGVLSIDDSQNTKLTTVNSEVEVTGKSGYGSYAIGNSRNSFYGTTFKVPDYSVILTGGDIIFGASSPEKVAELNDELGLELTQEEINAIEPKETVINSDRFGVMCHGNGTVTVMDVTEFNCGEAIFLVKGVKVDFTVDGSNGAELHSGTGVILQAIDNDDPGPVMVNGTMVNKGVYREPTEAPVKIKDFDLTAINENDITATFSDISIEGDFYNAITGNATGGAMGSGGPNEGGPEGGIPPPGVGVDSREEGPGGPGGGPGGPGGGPGGPGGPSGKNMVLTFENSTIAGVITSSTAKHVKAEITSEDYKLLGEVTNTPGKAVNNGVIVSLQGSTWTVSGTSYLTSLTISDDASVQATDGAQLTMTVNGITEPIRTGTYTGEIVLKVTNN